MDWITDTAYRYIIYKIFSKYRSPTDKTILTTEFMSSDGWIKNPHGVKKHLLTIKTKSNIQTIAQIFWGNLENLIKTAQDIQKMQIFNWIELNIGCPSPKVMKLGWWSALMKDPSKAARIIMQLAKSINLPFSIKTRTGFNSTTKDQRFDTLVNIAPFVSMITIHWRTYSQWHSGDVDRNFIYSLKEKVKNKVLIIWNWGITSYDQALSKKENLDWIAIGRGAIGNPWIITPYTPSPEEKKDTMIEHFYLMLKTQDYFKTTIKSPADKPFLNPSLKNILHSPISHDNKATIEFRKHFMSYIKGHPKASQLRAEISKIYDYKKLISFLSSF